MCCRIAVGPRSALHATVHWHHLAGQHHLSLDCQQGSCPLQQHLLSWPVLGLLPLHEKICWAYLD